MNFLRWLFCFPMAMLASFIGWAIGEKIFTGVASTYGGGLLRSLFGLLPLLITAAFPTTVFVVGGVLTSPSKERRVCFVFFGLSLIFSAGGINALIHQDSFPGFWLASVAGVAIGGILGLIVALRMQRARKPIQTPEPMSGLAPGHGSS
ncbi:MAG: hypothetical protein ACOZE5_12485 [Verrucomicrobiota bacterium]